MRKSPSGITLADQRRFIAAIAESYSDARWTKLEQLQRELAPVVASAPEGHVLELGAGAGTVLEAIQSLGRWSVGVEAVPEMVAEARKHGAEPMVLADGVSLPFPDRTFALVTLWGNTLGPIPGVENRVGLLREVRRVLSDEGILAAAVLNRYAGPRRLFRPLEYLFHVRDRDGRPVSSLAGYNRFYTPAQLKQELRAAGFHRFKRVSTLFSSALVMLARA